MSKRLTWKGRAATLALIKSAAEAGVEMQLDDFPNFKFTPGAGRPVVDAKPSNRRVHIAAKPHMKGCTNWSPQPLGWGPSDYKVPMAGDDYRLEQARSAWADGNPQQLRDYLQQRKET